MRKVSTKSTAQESIFSMLQFALCDSVDTVSSGPLSRSSLEDQGH